MAQNSIGRHLVEWLVETRESVYDFVMRHSEIDVVIILVGGAFALLYMGIGSHNEYVAAKLQPAVAVAKQKADLEKAPPCEALERIIHRHEEAIKDVQRHKTSVDYQRAYEQLRDQARACAASSASTAERR